METEQINLKVPPLDVVYPKERAVPKYMPANFFIGLLCGSRGCGKSTVLLQLVKQYEQTHTFDRIFLFAPTYKSDIKYKQFEKLDTELHVFHEYTDDLMEGVIADIKSGIDAHTAYLEQLKVYKKWMRDKDELRDFQSKALRTLEALDYRRPENPYPRGPPVSLCIFDDCVGSSLYRPTVTGAANTFFIAHRHYRTNLLFVSQVFHGGVPRGLRSNLSFLILFPNKNRGMAKEIASEFSAYISIEQFQAMWDFATKEPYGFLLCDFDSKQFRFRSGWNKAFVLPKITAAT